MADPGTPFAAAGPQVFRSLAAGFGDPVIDSQMVFRRVMEALASPGRVRDLAIDMSPDVPLLPTAAAVVLALCDFETQLYLAPHVAALPGVAEFLRFHSDAVLVPEPSRAAFAVLDLANDVLDLASFALGSAEYPDRSTTIIACCSSVVSGMPLAITGPGIAGVSNIRVERLPTDFQAQWASNRAGFPLGVDLVFVAPGQIVGLPRSSRIIGEIG